MSDTPPPPEWDQPQTQVPPPPPDATWAPPPPPPPPGPAAYGTAPAPYVQPGPYQPGAYPGNDPRKSKLAAGLLAILIPGFGIHNFYLGYTGKAIAQLVLTLTCIGAIVSWIWSIVEGIMIFTGSINVDAQGIPLKD